MIATKHDWSIQNRPGKAICRSRAIQNIPKNSGGFHLFLPGESCYDLKEALRLERINKDTKIIAIEQDGKLLEDIKGKIKRLGLKNVIYHRGPINSLKLKSVLPQGEKISFAFLDFCGEFTPQISIWLSRLDKSIVEDGAFFGFTFSFFRRGLEWRKATINGGILGKKNKFGLTHNRIYNRGTLTKYLPYRLKTDFDIQKKLLGQCIRNGLEIKSNGKFVIEYLDCKHWMNYLECKLMYGKDNRIRPSGLTSYLENYKLLTLGGNSIVNTFLQRKEEQNG